MVLKVKYTGNLTSQKLECPLFLTIDVPLSNHGGNLVRITAPDDLDWRMSHPSKLLQCFIQNYIDLVIAMFRSIALNMQAAYWMTMTSEPWIFIINRTLIQTSMASNPRYVKLLNCNDQFLFISVTINFGMRVRNHPVLALFRNPDWQH